MNSTISKAPIIEREYGDYHARICFAPQDVTDAEKNLLDLIMETYRQRVERQSQ